MSLSRSVFAGFNTTNVTLPDFVDKYQSKEIWRRMIPKRTGLDQQPCGDHSPHTISVLHFRTGTLFEAHIDNSASSGTLPRVVMFKLPCVGALEGFHGYAPCCRTIVDDIMTHHTNVVLHVEYRTAVDMFAEVRFGAALQDSLSGRLLSRGICRIVRPLPSPMGLIEAERRGLDRNSPAVVLREKELLPSSQRILRAVVVDVMEGTWLRARILAEEHLTTQNLSPEVIKTRSTSQIGSTVLVSIDGIVSDDPRTSSGFRAMRLSQIHLFHAVVRLVVRSVRPSDKDLSNNTQESTWNQLAHFEASVLLTADTLWDHVSPDLRNENPPARLLPDSSGDHVQERLASVGGDWGRLLVRLGLAKLHPTHPNRIRNANFYDLLLDVDEYMKSTCGPTTTATATPNTALPDLSKYWHRFLSHYVPPVGDPIPPFSHHFNDPLNTMLARNQWVGVTAASPCAGVIHDVDYVPVVNNNGTEEATRFFVRLSISMAVPGSVINVAKDASRSHERGAVLFYPPPSSIESIVGGEGGGGGGGSSDEKVREEFCYGPQVDVNIRFDPQLSDVIPTNCELTYSVVNAPVSSLDGRASSSCRSIRPPSEQQPIPFIHSEAVTIRLSLPKGVDHRLFVVWVNVKTQGRTLHNVHSAYVLHCRGALSIAIDDAKCIDADESDGIAVGQHDTDAAEGPAVPPTASSASSSSDTRWKPTHTYHGLVDVYFPTSLRRTDKYRRLSWSHVLLYKDVHVRFVGRCVVNGRHGYFAQLRSDDACIEPFVAEHLAGEETFLAGIDAAIHAPDVRSSPLSDHSPDGDAQALHAESQEWVETHGSPLAIVPADHCPSDLLYRATLGDPTIPLATFAVAPVQLFASHPKHHRNIIPENAKAEAKGYAHINAAFWRLRFSRLLNISRCNLDRCLSLQLGAAHLQAPLPTDVAFVALEKPLASLLAALFLLHPRQVQPPSPGAVPQAFFKNVKFSVSNFRTSGVLYSRPHSHDSTEATDLTPLSSNVLMYTGRRSFAEVLTEPSSSVVFPAFSLPGSVASDVVAAVAAVAAAAPPVEEALCDVDRWLPDASIDRPMGAGGLGRCHNADRPWWFYRPSGNVGVIGAPLLTKPQYTFLSSDDSIVNPIERAEVGFQYVSMGAGGRGTKSLAALYKLSSYGQLSRDLIFRHHYQQFRSGRFLVQYFGLLLRRRRREKTETAEGAGNAEFPNGLLRVVGNAHEPLYIFYLDRRSLRGVANISFVSELNSGCNGDAHEARLFEELLSTAERILQDVHVACGRVRSFIRIETSISGDASMCTIQAFPVNDTGGDSEEDGGGDERSFEMSGNVFGRLPSVQVKVWWGGGAGSLLNYELVKLR